MHVYILTCCRSADTLFANTLVFRTLRIGFPTATVHVFDNASTLEARFAIRAQAAQVGAEFQQIENRVRHDSFISWVTGRQVEGTLVLCDPDICFWRNMETCDFGDALFAGRLIPDFECQFTRCLTQARIHTSLFWIPDMTRFNQAIDELRQEYFEFDPFRPLMFKASGRWHRSTRAARFITRSRARPARSLPNSTLTTICSPARISRKSAMDSASTQGTDCGNCTRPSPSTLTP
jgi:hypothetical protein